MAALQPVVERYVTASDGVQIYATAVGQSHLPSLVFVHGFTASALIWASILANSNLLKHFYLVAYELRGHGRSGKPSTADGYLSHLFAEDFANVAREFGLNSPIFIGWSYGATIVADIFTHLKPGSISGVVYTAPLPWTGPILQDVATPFFASELLPGLTSFDNATAAINSHIKMTDNLVNEPEKVPVETKWAWIGSSVLVGPLSTQLLFGREQDPEALLKAAEAGLPTLLITGGRDKLLESEVVKELLERNFTNLVTRNFPEGSHTMFYELEGDYVREVMQFAASVFGNKMP